jgi:hypothetical protein
MRPGVEPHGTSVLGSDLQDNSAGIGRREHPCRNVPRHHLDPSFRLAHRRLPALHAPSTRCVLIAASTAAPEDATTAVEHAKDATTAVEHAKAAPIHRRSGRSSLSVLHH